MDHKLWLVTYSCSEWCGADDSKIVVTAANEDIAVEIAESEGEQLLQELFSSELDEFEGELFSLTSVEPFGPDHEEWKYYVDPTQAEFYPRYGD